MPNIVQRPCVWCGLPIDTLRSHTRLHGKCHSPLHRARQKLMPGEGPGAFFSYIEIEVSQGRHPNKNHPLHNKEESPVE